MSSRRVYLFTETGEEQEIDLHEEEHTQEIDQQRKEHWRSQAYEDRWERPRDSWDY